MNYHLRFMRWSQEIAATIQGNHRGAEFFDGACNAGGVHAAYENTRDGFDKSLDAPVRTFLGTPGEGVTLRRMCNYMRASKRTPIIVADYHVSAGTLPHLGLALRYHDNPMKLPAPYRQYFVQQMDIERYARWVVFLLRAFPGCHVQIGNETAFQRGAAVSSSEYSTIVNVVARAVMAAGITRHRLIAGGGGHSFDYDLVWTRDPAAAGIAWGGHVDILHTYATPGELAQSLRARVNEAQAKFQGRARIFDETNFVGKTAGGVTTNHGADFVEAGVWELHKATQSGKLHGYALGFGGGLSSWCETWEGHTLCASYLDQKGRPSVAALRLLAVGEDIGWDVDSVDPIDPVDPITDATVEIRLDNLEKQLSMLQKSCSRVADILMRGRDDNRELVFGPRHRSAFATQHDRLEENTPPWEDVE